MNGLPAREVRSPEPDVGRGHVAPDEKELVDRLAGPIRIAQLLVGQEQHAAALAPALAEELLSLEEGRDAEEGHRHGLSAPANTLSDSVWETMKALVSALGETGGFGV